MKPIAVSTLLLAVALSPAPLLGADAVDFKRQVKPILEVYCLKCHGEEKPKGKLSLVTRASTFKGGEDGPAIVDRDPAKSPLYTTTTLPADHDDVMPPKGEKLSKAQQDVLKAWIEQGASWPESFRLAQKEKVEFSQVRAVFEVHCVSCHKEGHAKGDLRMDVREEFFKSKAIVAGDAEKSTVYTTMILPEDHDDLMPPKKKGGPLPKAKTEVVREWIEQGAMWPEGVKLTEKEPTATSTRDTKLVLEAVYKRIAAATTSISPGDMKPYRGRIDGTDATFDMLPIPGGEFTMGSAAGEAGRSADEGPTRKVRIEPFWMGKTEVTWDEYEVFMFPSLEKGTNVSTERINRELFIMLPEKPPGLNAGNPYVGMEADAVSRPTTPYVEMSFGMGKDRFPAISMTHFAAIAYCRWLSAKTGHFYRLPTEAEWEYACRAGTTTRYSFGDDPKQLDEYAWYFDNSDGKYQKVAKKKPNPWGLHDMHGNVAEWVYDGYSAEAYSKLGGDGSPFPPFAEYPHAARGGSWNDDAGLLRSAARLGSDASWKMRDPQLPKSKWYLTDATFLGFRIVRPLKVPSQEEVARYWTSFPGQP